MTVDEAMRTALMLHQAGRLAEAEGIYRQVLGVEPGNAEALHLMGAIAGQSGRYPDAVKMIQRAIAIAPERAEFHCNLGLFLQNQDRLAEAMACYVKALSLKEDYPEAHFNLGNALKDVGRLDDALACYYRAVTLRPQYADAHCNRGLVLERMGVPEAAVEAFKRAIALVPRLFEAHVGLGKAVGGLGRNEEAIAIFREAVAMGRAAHKPQRMVAGAHGNLLLALHYPPSIDPQEIWRESRQWDLLYARPLAGAIRPFANDRNPERRLRIGYCSADFRFHAVAPLVLPLIANHDRTQFEITLYFQGAGSDAMTQKFRQCADQWRVTGQLTDERMAELVREDRIDILIDLAGHTAGNRLLVFARKAAPVQAGWQGYPNSSGLDAVDYRMSDGYADPPGLSDTLYSEKIIRLEPTNWIYQPDADAPEAAALHGGGITFGCFNNFAKVTDPMLRLWGRILAAVPESRLLLKANGLASPLCVRRVQSLFGEIGIAPQRLDLRGQTPTTAEHLALYGQVGIALDPYPYHGTTTTCEALWMGAPVVTLAGQTHVSRVGVSLLSHVGLPELIASTPEEYVRIAVDLAHDRARLAQLRRTLRQRMRESPLMDFAAFARNVEAEYRAMWRKWCAGQSGGG